MMRHALAVAAFLAAVTFLPDSAMAQRWGRSGPAMTPYGPVYNPTQSPEWRQAGGNPFLFQQLMEQKMAIAQQKAMTKQQQNIQKQQQAFQKWLKDQKAKKDKGEPYDLAYDQYLKAQNAQAQATLNGGRRGTSKRATAKKEATTPKAGTADTKKADSAPADKPKADK